MTIALEVATTATAHDDLPTLEDGSINAQALFHIWRGVPGVVIQAPPGAGKSFLIETVIPHLTKRAGLSVAVATQTRTQAIDLADRIAAKAMPVNLVPSSRDRIGNGDKAFYKRPRALAQHITFKPVTQDGQHRVQVANVHKWRHEQNYTADVLIVDEAYQATWAMVRELGRIAPQIVLIGDPGQIAPIVSTDTTRWDEHPRAPHHPGPAVLAATHPDHVARLSMPHTYRCGPDTAKVIAPLYPFEFDSARPDTTITTSGTLRQEFTVLSVDATGPADDALYDAVAAEALTLAEGIYRREGQPDRRVGGKRVCVAVAHVIDTVAVASRLPEGSGITVDTLERLQGLEFDATVLLDPMAGRPEITDHDGDTGRLCVGLSRHTATCTVITTPQVLPVLDKAAAEGDAIAELGAKVRRSLARLQERP